MKNLFKGIPLFAAALAFSMTINSPKTFAYGGGGIVWFPPGFPSSVSSVGRVLGATAFQFTKNLSFGSSDSEVLALQKFLNLKGYTVSTTGAGSKGNETSYFGNRTKSALIRYQNDNKDILDNAGIKTGTGNFFLYSKEFINTILEKDSEISRLISEN